MESIQMHPAGITYTNPEGVEELIDGTIVEDLSAPSDGYVYVANKNRIRSAFKKDPTATAFVKVIYPDLDGDGVDDEVTYTLKNLYLYDISNPANRMLLESPANVEPIVTRNSIRYTSIFTGADLVFTVANGKLKETIELQEAFMQTIPDPFKIGYDPDTSKVVIEVEISFNGKLITDSNNQILCQNERGITNLFIEAVTAQSVTGDLLPYHVYQEFDADTGTFLYGLAYITTQRTPYPMAIDPTISTSLYTDFGDILETYDSYYGTQLSVVNSSANDSYTIGYTSTTITV